MTEWVDVKERLPEIGQEFLGWYSADETIDHFTRTGETEYWNLNSNNKCRDDLIGGYVTHWRDVPKAP